MRQALRVLMMVSAAAAALGASAGKPAVPPLIPFPAQLTLTPGVFRPAGDTARDLRAACGDNDLALRAWLGGRPASPALDIRVTGGDSPLGAEGYRLRVTAERIAIEADRPAGAFYAVQTLCQLVPASDDGPFTLPALDITDSPRFRWRGMHLDVSRHFFTKEEIKRYVDLLGRFKLNVFHWHLTDDGGWRVEIKRFPRLTEVGAWRRPMREVWSQEKLDFPGAGAGEQLYGGFYSQDDVREIVAYAAARHVTVVPEIELPGHCLPALFAYPELKCDGVSRPAGRAYDATAMCPGKEWTFTFLEGVLTEILELFPSKVIHVGGDEVDRSAWSVCPQCRRRIEDESLAGTAELQSYTIRRVERFLNQHGRTLIGWDEILEGGLAPNAMVMSWRGVAGGIAAARAGHPVIMSPTSHCYFDYAYENISTRRVYAYDPVPADLTADEAGLVLGAQGNVWTEWMPDFARVQTMVLPRMLALAEVLWSPKAGRSPDEFERRLAQHYGRFDRAELAYYFAPPSVGATVVVFAKSAKLALPASDVPGVVLRVERDGRAPTAASPRYGKPIKVSKDTELRAAWFGAKGRLGDEVTVRAVRSRGGAPADPVPGLSYARISARFDSMPDFAALTPDSTGIQAAPDIAPLDPGTPFGVEWRGYVRVPRQGRYVFTLGSDDGSVLWVHDTPVVPNDGLHGYLEKSGAADLTAGYHPIRIAYFNALGARSLKVWIEGPGLPRQPLGGDLVTRAR
jgi:hexosaminidase